MGNSVIHNKEQIIEVEAGYLFNHEGFVGGKKVITDESVLAALEMRYKIQIALAIEYKARGETKSIRIVTKDRKHYKIIF